MNTKTIQNIEVIDNAHNRELLNRYVDKEEIEEMLIKTK